MRGKSTPNKRENRRDASLRPVLAALAVMLYGTVVVVLFGHFSLNHIPIPDAIRLATVTSADCAMA